MWTYLYISISVLMNYFFVTGLPVYDLCFRIWRHQKLLDYD